MPYGSAFLVLFLSASKLHGIEGYESCLTLNSYNQDAIRICYDSYYNIGYCCDLEHDKYYQACCSTPKVWAMWYFWIGLFGGFILLTGIVCLIASYAERSQQSRRTAVASVSSPETTAMSVFQVQPPPVTVTYDPPAYEELNAITLKQQLPQQLYPTETSVQSELTASSTYSCHAEQPCEVPPS